MALRNFFASRLFTPFLTGIAAFVIYFSCLSPTVTYNGDSGELIVASWTGGVPHPTGYALYAVLGWIFAHLLPFGEVAWRYNLLSALMGSLAVALVAASVERLTKQRMAALVAALSLAGLFYFASQSVLAEVYASNSALLALLFYAAIRWKLDKQWTWLAILAVSVGLIPNAHMSSIYLLPGLAVFLWPHQWHCHPKVLFRQHSKRLAGLALLVLLGFSLTLYLPWRARQFPPPTAGPGGTLIYQPQDWGHPATLQSWWSHVSAKQYHSLLWTNRAIHIGNLKVVVPTFTEPPSHALGQTIGWLEMMLLQYLWLILLTVWGALVCWKFAPRLGWLLWLSFGINLFLEANYKVNGVADIANFVFPCYIVMALWTGIGYYAASKVLLEMVPQKAKLGILALRILAFSAIAAQWMMIYPLINLRDNTRARDTALERTSAAQQLQDQTGKPPSVLMTNDDTLFPFWYAQKVLGKAPDARTPWGDFRHYYSDRGRLVDLVSQLQNQGPVALAQWDAKTDAKFPLIPLNVDGTLWMASKRTLPESAKVLSLLNAGNFQWPQAVMPSAQHSSQSQKPMPVAKNGELFASNAVWYFNPEQPHAILAKDSAHHSIQIGWIEIFYGSANQPAPSQQFQQRVRFVIPTGIKQAGLVMTTLPLQIPRTFEGSSCTVWMRFVGKTKGAWRNVQTFQVILQ